MGEMELNKIYCGDSAEVLKGFPDGCIDLTVTSPPYGALRDYDGYVFDFEAIAQQLYRVTKQGGIIVWVVGDETLNSSESGMSFQQALFFMQCGLNLHDTMIYLKYGISYPSNNRYHQVFEYMFVFSKGKPKAINLITDKKNRWRKSFGVMTARQKDGSLKPRKKVVIGNVGRRTNVWAMHSGKGYATQDEFAYEHPAMFPEALANGHILSWSNHGDVVLDPMCGSGTTLKMAKQLGRHWIGIDVSKCYCELSRKRVAGANVPLFTE